MKTSMKIGIGVFLAVVVVGIIVGISVLNSEPTQNEPIQNVGNNVVTDNKEENNTPINTELTVDAVKRAKETPASQFEYEDVEGGVAITGYNGKAEIVVIPEKINGKDVVEIGRYAFANNDIVKAVKISDSVKVIEEQAFGNCTSLEILLCGSSLETIEKFAFNNTTALTIVELNEGLLNLKRSCFGMPTFKEIVIPSSVTYMDFPFIAIGGDKITVISESGSYVETKIIEWGERYGLEFKAK